jgi:crossover junction endodeoxyribonuclease RuvC
MTFRITLGIDPGQTGAIAVIADGQPVQFIDMPTMPRSTTGNEINAAQLAALMRGVMNAHHGAHILTIVESVHSMPSMSAPSVFKFGESFGVLKGVLGSLGIGFRLVQPEKWKKHFRIQRSKDEREAMGQAAYKDLSRTVAIQRFPHLAADLARKKDGGRADALLMALWAAETELAAQQAAA